MLATSNQRISISSHPVYPIRPGKRFSSWSIAPLVAITALIAVGVATAQTPRVSSVSNSNFRIDDAQSVCHLDLCRVLVINDVEVPALENGAIMSVMIKDGQFVQKGVLLAQINDRQSQLQKQAAEKELIAAQARASEDIEVRFAQASFDVADTEYQQGMELNAKRGKLLVSASEMRKRRLTRYRSELEIDKARLDQRVAQLSSDIQRAAVDLANESIQRRKIVSPLDGIAVPVYRGEDNLPTCQVGQWVSAGEPVVRIIRMDRLYVEGLVSSAAYSPSDIDGKTVTVDAELARGRKEQFQGKIVFISPEMDKRNNFRVRAEVENRTEKSQWLLRPGASASMTIHLQ